MLKVWSAARQENGKIVLTAARFDARSGQVHAFTARGRVWHIWSKVMTLETSIVDARPSNLWARGARNATRRQAHSGVASTDVIGAEMERPLILIVDDDERVRTALAELMLSVGLDAICFASTRELLDADLRRRPGCLVLDVRMPGSSGLDLQNHLVTKGDAPPIIFLTGHGDIPMTVRAMKAGAVDFLTKPVRDQALLDAVTAGIERDIARRSEALLVKRHADRLATLTQRERQVFREVARGRVNKQIAFDLGISVVTVKLHRSNVMRKMQAASVGELIRAWETLHATMRDAHAT
jgi:FixJ family two-component response regulator